MRSERSPGWRGHWTTANLVFELPQHVLVTTQCSFSKLKRFCNLTKYTRYLQHPYETAGSGTGTRVQTLNLPVAGWRGRILRGHPAVGRGWAWDRWPARHAGMRMVRPCAGVGEPPQVRLAAANRPHIAAPARLGCCALDHVASLRRMVDRRRRRAIANSIGRQIPPIRQGSGSYPKPLIRLWYSAGDPAKRDARWSSRRGI